MVSELEQEYEKQLLRETKNLESRNYDHFELITKAVQDFLYYQQQKVTAIEWRQQESKVIETPKEDSK